MRFIRRSRYGIILILTIVLMFGCKNEKVQKIFIEDIISEEFVVQKTENRDIEPVYESNIFENDLFLNISKEPEFYQNNILFTFNEYFPEFIHKGTPEKYIKVENDEIEIVYYPDNFSLNGKYIIQFVTLKKFTNKYCFGNLFGKSSEEILNLFPYNKFGLRGGEISYNSDGYINFVVFKIKNNIVYSISYGENI